MIDDAIPWKDELLRVADRLEKKTKQDRWTNRTCYLIERDFMVSAYAIRKLRESFKVSDRFKGQNVRLERFKRSGRLPDCDATESIEALAESYDLENGQKSNLPIKELCNQFIHSFVLLFCCDEETNHFDRVYVTSESRRDDWLYLVHAAEYIQLCRDIGTDEIISKTWALDKDNRLTVTEIVGEQATQLASQL